MRKQSLAATKSLSMRPVIIAISVNTILAAVKGIAGVLGNSYALIADAIESTLDIVSSLVVYGSLKIAFTPADKNHPYGHGKAEPLAAVVVALALGAAAIGIAIQSIREIMIPHHAPAPFTLVVLLAVIIIKETLFRFVFKVGEVVESSVLKSDAWHHRSDAITSAAAFVGISIALLGGENYESADDWAALLAAGIIAYNARRLIRPAIAEVMDAAMYDEVEQEIRRIAGAIDGVIDLDKCLVRKAGFEYFVDLHVIVAGDISVRDGHEIAHIVKDAIRGANSKVTDVLIHIEPAPPG